MADFVEDNRILWLWFSDESLAYKARTNPLLIEIGIPHCALWRFLKTTLAFLQEFTFRVVPNKFSRDFPDLLDFP